MSDTWENTELEPAFTRPGQPLGWVYFIACTQTQRCKIGFTRGEVEKRLKALQTGSASELSLIAMQPGSVDTERALHERFAQYRIQGEWFEMSEPLFAYICLTVWSMAGIYSDKGVIPPEWMRLVLRMMREMSGPLPDHLEAML